MKPSEEITSGNSAGRSEIHLGVARRLALREADLKSGEVDRTMDGEVGESVLKTLWLDTSSKRL